MCVPAVCVQIKAQVLPFAKFKVEEAVKAGPQVRLG